MSKLPHLEEITNKESQWNYIMPTINSIMLISVFDLTQHLSILRGRIRYRLYHNQGDNYLIDVKHATNRFIKEYNQWLKEKETN